MEFVKSRREDTREIRIEGVLVWVVVVGLLAGLAAAYALGFRSGRKSGAAGAARSERAVPALASEPVDVGEDLSFFDKLSGGGQHAEPRREAGGAAPPPATTERRETAPDAGGDWYVQVFAGRDREAAELLVRDLTGKSHRVRVASERDGAGALFKVRVGGFASREAADAAVPKLRAEGYSGAWVTRVER